MVSSAIPACRFVGFDLWMENYAGMENPGPDFVASELRRLGHTGTVTLVSGDSHVTVPEWFTAHPDAAFDLVTVDGDHSDDGARADLLAVMPRVRPGGVLVFDDVSHDAHTGLTRVWAETVGADSRWTTWAFDEVGFGVALAVRRV